MIKNYGETPTENQFKAEQLADYMEKGIEQSRIEQKTKHIAKPKLLKKKNIATPFQNYWKNIANPQQNHCKTIDTKL